MNTKDLILQRTRQGLDVFHHYIDEPFKPNKKFKNPLYQDTKASCHIYFNNKCGCYMMKDFGATEYSGDCFWFVAAKENMDVKKDFVQVLRKIDRDMNLYIMNDDMPRKAVRENATRQSSTNTRPLHEPSLPPVSGDESEKEPPAKAKIVFKAFTQGELDFWQKYGITEQTLNRFQVRSGKSYSSIRKDGQPYTIRSSEKEPMYVYTTIDDVVKVYLPFSKNRFLYGRSADGEYVYGMGQLPASGNIIFITGGEKDVMSLAAHGFHAVCFNSETACPPTKIIENLYLRFKHIVMLYDMDETGKKYSKKMVTDLAKYRVSRLELPLSGEKSEKDISDFFAMGHTAEELETLICQLIANLYKKDSVLLKASELDFSNPPLKSHSIVEVNDVPVGTCDNLFCLTGGEGAGKSNFISAIISGTLVKKPLDAERTLGLSITSNPQAKAVLLYDTEQSHHQLFKNVSKVLKRAYLSDMPNFFHAYHLATSSRQGRLDIIRTSLDLHYHQHKGIQLVVIDGVADLIRSANDEKESIEIVDELYRLAGFYHTCIICVLHFVPNGMKLRGHIGSELQRKAAGILSIEKEEGQQYSVVKVIKVRDGSPLDIPMMQVGWSKDEDMFVYQGVKTKEDKEKRKYKELLAVAQIAFKTTDRISYSDLTAFVAEKMHVQERTAKDYIKYMKEKDIIEKLDNSSLYQLKIFAK